MEAKILLIHTPKYSENQGSGLPKTGTRNTIQDLAWNSNQALGVTTCCLPWCISRKLNQEPVSGTPTSTLTWVASIMLVGLTHCATTQICCICLFLVLVVPGKHKLTSLGFNQKSLRLYAEWETLGSIWDPRFLDSTVELQIQKALVNVPRCSCHWGEHRSLINTHFVGLRISWPSLNKWTSSGSQKLKALFIKMTLSWKGICTGNSNILLSFLLSSSPFSFYFLAICAYQSGSSFLFS